jgi:ABC-type protease/lipase transport system fused ATPase/permease subunit
LSKLRCRPPFLVHTLFFIYLFIIFLNTTQFFSFFVFVFSAMATPSFRGQRMHSPTRASELRARRQAQQAARRNNQQVDSTSLTAETVTRLRKAGARGPGC